MDEQTRMKYTQLEKLDSTFDSVCLEIGFLRLASTSERKSLRKINWQLLAAPCESVWPELK